MALYSNTCLECGTVFYGIYKSIFFCSKCDTPEKENDMNNKLSYQYEQTFEMINSLQKATLDAGGKFLSLDEIKSMTAYDLCCLLGTNNVRFVYQKKDDVPF